MFCACRVRASQKNDRTSDRTSVKTNLDMGTFTKSNELQVFLTKYQKQDNSSNCNKWFQSTALHYTDERSLESFFGFQPQKNVLLNCSIEKKFFSFQYPSFSSFYKVNKLNISDKLPVSKKTNLTVVAIVHLPPTLGKFHDRNLS